jgi:hypothetical protein
MHTETSRYHDLLQWACIARTDAYIGTLSMQRGTVRLAPCRPDSLHKVNSMRRLTEYVRDPTLLDLVRRYAFLLRVRVYVYVYVYVCASTLLVRSLVFVPCRGGHPSLEHTLHRLLEFDPAKRITAREALQHAFFDVSDAEDCLESLSPSPVPLAISMIAPPGIEAGASHNLERNPPPRAERDASNTGKHDSSTQEWSDYDCRYQEQAQSAPRESDEAKAKAGADAWCGRTASNDGESSADTALREPGSSGRISNADTECAPPERTMSGESGSWKSREESKSEADSSAAFSNGGRATKSKVAPVVPPRQRTLSVPFSEKQGDATETAAATATSAGGSQVTNSKAPMRPAALHERRDAASRSDQAFGRALSADRVLVSGTPQKESDQEAGRRPVSLNVTATSSSSSVPIAGAPQPLVNKSVTAMVRGAKGIESTAPPPRSGSSSSSSSAHNSARA